MSARSRSTVLVIVATVTLLSLVGFLLALDAPMPASSDARRSTSPSPTPIPGGAPAKSTRNSTAANASAKPNGPRLNATDASSASRDTTNATHPTLNMTNASSPAPGATNANPTSTRDAGAPPFQIPIPSPGLLVAIVAVLGGFAVLVRAVRWRPLRGNEPPSAAFLFGAAAPDGAARAPPRSGGRPRDVVLALYFDACEALEALGCARAPHETAREYCERASDALVLDRGAFRELTTLFELARHGDWRVDEASGRRAAELASSVRAARVKGANPVDA